MRSSLHAYTMAGVIAGDTHSWSIRWWWLQGFQSVFNIPWKKVKKSRSKLSGAVSSNKTDIWQGQDTLAECLQYDCSQAR